MWPIEVDGEVLAEDMDCPFNVLDLDDPKDDGTLCHDPGNEKGTCCEEYCPRAHDDGGTL